MNRAAEIPGAGAGADAVPGGVAGPPARAGRPGPDSGFPNEKYASVSDNDEANAGERIDTPTDDTRADDARTDHDTPKTDQPADNGGAASRQERQFVVLPGESLAKYSDSTAPSESGSQHRRLEDARTGDERDGGRDASDEARGDGDVGEDNQLPGAEHENSSAEAGSDQRLDSQLNRHEPNVPANRVTPVEAIVAATDAAAESILQQPSDPDEMSPREEDADASVDAEVEAAAMPADEMPAEKVSGEPVVPESEAEGPDEASPDSEVEAGGERGEEQEFSAETAPEIAETSGDAEPDDQNRRMPGRPLPGEEGNGG